MGNLKRRDFLKTTGAALAATAAQPLLRVKEALPPLHAAPPVRQPIVIASGNGLRATEKAMQLLMQRSDALDAVVAGVNIIEDDPDDITVGYGGLPNEDGVVELDASVMHGPSHRAGAVAALQKIKNPSLVARTVMERSDHVLLVGKGALRFARAHGFQEMNLLTEKSRKIWLEWKEAMSTKDDWLQPHSLDDRSVGAQLREYARHYGTINCDALDLQGNLSGVTTTSGLAFKIAGRVGDSPIIGAGLYVDNEVGAAGSTGRGESNLVNCSSVIVVEAMRAGKSPEEACLAACRRIVDNLKEARLKNDDGTPAFNVNFYAINTKGEYGGAAIWSGSKFALHDGKENRLLECAYLYKKK